MTVRLNAIGDTSREDADMKINTTKTLTQHVYKRAHGYKSNRRGGQEVGDEI